MYVYVEAGEGGLVVQSVIKKHSRGAGEGDTTMLQASGVGNDDSGEGCIIHGASKSTLENHIRRVVVRGPKRKG